MTTGLVVQWGLGRGRKTAHVVTGQVDWTGPVYANCGRPVIECVEPTELGRWRECRECSSRLAASLAYGAEAPDPDEYDHSVMTAKLGGDSGEGNTPRRTIRIPDSEWNAAKAAADANGDTLSEVIRAALKRYTARTKRAEPPTPTS